MKRFLKALPVVLVGGLALTGCSVTETPVATDAITVQLNTHAEGDALGEAATSGKDVLGTEGVGIVSVFNQLGLSAASLDIASTNKDKKQTAQVELKGITGANATTLGQAAAAQFEQLKTSWLAVEGNAKKTDADFYADEQVRTQVTAVPGVAAGTLFPTVTEENGHHTATITPQFASTMSAHNAEATITLPGSATLEGAPAGVSVSGRDVVLNLAELKDNEPIKVSYSDPAPELTWWMSLILWAAGVLVTVLLLVIALAPRRRD